MKKRVEIRIGELVLHGIADGQRGAVGEAVQRELARIAAEGGFARGEAPAISPIRLPIDLPPGGKSS